MQIYRLQNIYCFQVLEVIPSEDEGGFNIEPESTSSNLNFPPTSIVKQLVAAIE
jgi:hypothetical protein